MSEDTQNGANSATTVTDTHSTTQGLLHSNWFLPSILVVSLICNIVLITLFVKEQNQEIPYVDMDKAFGPANQEPAYDYVENYEEETYPESYTNQYAVAQLTNDPRDYSSYYQNLVEQPGVVWFPKPVIVPDQKLYEYAPDGFTDTNYPPSTYYQIGTFNDDPIIFVLVPCDGMCTSHLVFVTHSDGTATLLRKNSNVELGTSWAVIKLATTVTIGESLEIKTLKAPEELQISPTVPLLTKSGFIVSMEIFSESEFNSAFAQGDGSLKRVIEFVADTEFGPLFSSYYTDSESVTIDIQYGLRLPGGLLMRYDEAALGFTTDDRVPQINWLAGGTNTEPYRGDRLTGCGGGGPEFLIKPLKEPQIELVGYTSTGEKVYSVIDPTHPLITRVFEMTQGIVYEYDSETGESSNRTITPAEFIANRGVLLVEAYGNQLVFTNTKYGPQAECGKPVIYLYPEATTTISVSVDALVTKSEPLYRNGWVATATPSGVLVVDGKPYTSLFWDGYGNGEYPEITEGFIVPTEIALETMAGHLRFMGFTEFEISEFVAFWADHMPSEPYTRITWFQTHEMERLARLTITPRPDTLFRAFVDYEGIDRPFDLPVQKLFATDRKGYVVTEWGGLLRK